MPRDWAKVQGGPGFKGLLRRRQMQLDDLAYFATLTNTDAYGGAIAKRAGSQFVNGFGTFATANVNPGATTIPVNYGLGFKTGAFGIYVGDYFLNNVQSVTFDTVVLSQPTPAGTFITKGDPVFQAYPAPGEIQTLFQGVFRNGQKVLYAAVRGSPYTVLRNATPQPVVSQYPIVTIASSPTTTGAVLSWVHGLAVGDWIKVDTMAYSVQIQSVDPVTKAVTWAPAFPGFPPVGTFVTFASLKSSDVLPPPEFVQYGNYTFMVGGFHTDGAGHGWPSTPCVIRQTNPKDPASSLIIHRVGVKPPLQTSYQPVFWNATTPAGGMVPGSKYRWRLRYFSSFTGQESEGGPEIEGTCGSAPSTSANLYLPGSPDPQVDYLRLYRTTTDGGGAWYLVQQFKIGSATGTDQQSPNIADPGAPNTITVVDYSSDAQLGKQMRNLMDWTIPDTISVLAVWGQANRLIGIDRVQNAVWFSDQPDLQTGRLKGESWPVNNQIFIAYDDGDPLTGLAAFFDSVLVFKEHSVWRITGIPPDIRIEPLHYRQDQTATGCTSQRQILVDHDEVVYRGSDAIYELNRFQGQAEGFQSKRLSLPIDEAVQRGYDEFDEEKVGHGVFFRYKRQIRFWETTARALVLQFESSAEGEPFGWMEWTHKGIDYEPFPSGPMGPRCSCVARYDAAVFRGSAAYGVPVDAAVFVAIDGGMVVQLDVGTCDYGFNSYEVAIQSLQFAPGGRGTPARARALDWQVVAVNLATAEIEWVTDWLTPNAPITAPLTVPDGDGFFGANQIDLIGVPLGPFQTLATLVIAPGHHHQFAWREESPTSYYRIQGWTYWYQTLPEQAVWRRYKQTVRGSVIVLPNP
jgi:hypothetical protein